MQWVTRITTVSLLTVLPILGGRWLDDRFATSYWGVVGLVLGLVVGFWQMMLLVKSAGAKSAALRKFGGSDRDVAGHSSGSAGSSAGVGSATRSSSGRSLPASSASLSDETAEIAKRIDDVLGKKK